MSTIHPESQNVQCELRNVTRERLRKQPSVRFIVFLVQGRVFKLIADGDATHAGAISRDQSTAPLGANKLAYGCMRIARDGTFNVATHPYPEALPVDVPDVRTPLLEALNRMGIEIE